MAEEASGKGKKRQQPREELNWGDGLEREKTGELLPRGNKELKQLLRKLWRLWQTVPLHTLTFFPQQLEKEE